MLGFASHPKPYIRTIVFETPSRKYCSSTFSHRSTNITTSDDVNELLSLVKQLEGLPSNPNEDIYGFDTHITLTTFELQWDNGEDVDGAESISNLTDENKQTFKDVMDSISSLARQTAK